MTAPAGGPANNGWGSYETTIERQMGAFDSLPKRLRRAIADSPVDVAAEPYLDAVRQRWPLRTLLIEVGCMRPASGEQRQVWGPDYPVDIVPLGGRDRP